MTMYLQAMRHSHQIFSLQLGGCVRESAGAQFEDATNGLRSMDGTKGSWELPLQPHNGGIEPDWTWAGDEHAARREAAERLTANYEGIVKFAARGAGKKGMPRYGAPLSDPNAISNEAVQTAVDQVLRTVCLALLEGTDKLDVTMSEMATVMAKQGGKEYAGGVVASLAYLRDRVGVPRDMRLPAAQQLRAHLNWAIGNILDASA
jgi:glutathione S-transferase